MHDRRVHDQVPEWLDRGHVAGTEQSVWLHEDVWGAEIRFSCCEAVFVDQSAGHQRHCEGEATAAAFLMTRVPGSTATAIAASSRSSVRALSTGTRPCCSRGYDGGPLPRRGAVLKHTQLEHAFRDGNPHQKRLVELSDLHRRAPRGCMSDSKAVRLRSHG